MISYPATRGFSHNDIYLDPDLATSVGWERDFFDANVPIWKAMTAIFLSLLVTAIFCRSYEGSVTSARESSWNAQLHSPQFFFFFFPCYAIVLKRLHTLAGFFFFLDSAQNILFLMRFKLHLKALENDAIRLFLFIYFFLNNLNKSAPNTVRRNLLPWRYAGATFSAWNVEMSFFFFSPTQKVKAVLCNVQS